tara:strand:- start:1210 stop:1317 length:108 start_codon:yes stop_codon:yes gene_type:complete
MFAVLDTAFNVVSDGAWLSAGDFVFGPEIALKFFH